MKIFNNKRIRAEYLWFVFPVLIFSLLVCSNPASAIAADLGKAVSLKIRVYVKLESSLEEKLKEEEKHSGNYQNVTISVGTAKSKTRDKKTGLEQDQVYGLLRTVKIAVADSDTIRVMDDDVRTEGQSFVPYSLLVDAEYDGSFYSIYLRIVDTRTGDIHAAGNFTSENMVLATRKAVHSIEDKIVLNPWWCRVTSAVSSNQSLIPRGYEDGIYEGLEFVGYAFSVSQTEEQVKASEELSILKYENKQGRYRVVETMRNHSKLARLQESPQLKTGDIIAMPGVVLKKDNPKQSKGRKAWQKIYNKE